jgi:type VI secretion system secreted protein VgrG
VIAGSIPNAAQPSITNSDNQTNSLIQTAAGNKIEIEDKNGKNRIKLQTGDNKTYMHLGAPNHPGDGFVVMSKGIERKEITGGKQITLVARGQIENLHDKSSDKAGLQTANSSHKSGKLADKKDLIDEQEYFQFPIKSKKGDGRAAIQDTFSAKKIDDTDIDLPTDKLMTRDIELSGYYLIERIIGDKYIFEQGNEYQFNSPGDKCFIFGADKDVTLCQDDSNLRANTDTSAGPDVSYDKSEPSHIQYNQSLNGQLGDLGLDAVTPGDAERLVSSLTELLVDKMSGYQSFTKGTDGNYKRWSGKLSQMEANDLLDNKSQTSVAKHNTFNIQEGNIFDFGGYWNYDLGNSYTEVHGSQNATINAIVIYDLADIAGPNWTTIKGKDLEIKNTGDVQVEKAYGNDYAFREGNTIDVQNGHAESQHYGNSNDYHDGDSYEVHEGDSYSKQWGRCDEMFMGGKSEFNLAATSSIELSVSSEIKVGFSNEMFLGVKTSVDIAPGLYFSAGSKTEIESISFNIAGSEMDAKIASMTSAINTTAAMMNEISTTSIRIGNAMTKLEGHGFAIESGAIKMIA